MRRMVATQVNNESKGECRGLPLPCSPNRSQPIDGVKESEMVSDEGRWANRTNSQKGLKICEMARTVYPALWSQPALPLY